MNKNWHQGKGNIFTIISFITLLWPISVIVMWLLSNWSKSTKKQITILVYLPVLTFILGRLLSAPKRIDPHEFQGLSNFILVYFPIIFLLSLIVVILSYVFSPRLITKNWKYIFGSLVSILGAWFLIIGFLTNLIYW